MKKFLLSEKGNFYKANLHCHTTFSDGSYTPEQMKEEYKSHGYSVVAYTDHDIYIAHPDLRDEDFLPLNGFEIEVGAKDGPRRAAKCCHLCFIALDEKNLIHPLWHRSKYLASHAPEHKDEVLFDENVPDFEREYTPENINTMIKIGREKGFFVTYNHPTWSQESYPEYMAYSGMNAMEICNYGSCCLGFPDYNARVYDDMLRDGKKIYCIGADDNHNRFGNNDSFGAFTMIKADKLEYGAITKALESGNFYASQGPEIYDLYVEDEKVHITCSPCREITMQTGVRSAGRIFDEDGKITGGEFEISDDMNYFRLTVTDKCGKKADTHAYFIEDIK